MKFTIRKIIGIFENLKLLNGRESVLKSNGLPDRVVVEPYRFAASATWAIAKNLNAFKVELDHFNTARTAIHEGCGGVEGAADPAKIAEFSKEVNALLDQETKIAVTKIKLSALNLDTNSIQPGCLAAISDLIDES